MDITKDNFNDLLPSILTTLEQSDFISIDTEFTGLNFEDQIDNLLDSIEERYQNRINRLNFLITQFGVTCFVKKGDGYVAESFNFWVFPSAMVDSWFVCQSGSMRYLAEHCFDFNKWINMGIPYLNVCDEKRILDKLLLVNDKQIVVSDVDRGYVESVVELINAWDFDETGEMLVPPCSSYRRKILYQNLPKLFFGFSIDSVEVGNSKSIRIVKMSNEELQAKETERIAEIKENLQSEIGFRLIIDKIIEMKKPLIGHNMFMDLILIYHQFIGKLPRTSNDFRDRISELFPSIIDTRILAKQPLIKPLFPSSVLTALYERVNELFDAPLIEFEGNSSGYKSDYHVAGFDSFITGVVFIKLHFQYYENVDTFSDEYTNIIPLMKSLFDLVLRGNEDSSIPDNIVYVKHKTEQDRHFIIDHFSQYGYVQTKELSETEILVCIGRMSVSAEILLQEFIINFPHLTIEPGTSYYRNN